MSRDLPLREQCPLRVHLPLRERDRCRLSLQLLPLWGHRPWFVLGFDHGLKRRSQFGLSLVGLQLLMHRGRLPSVGMLQPLTHRRLMRRSPWMSQANQSSSCAGSWIPATLFGRATLFGSLSAVDLAPLWASSL